MFKYQIGHENGMDITKGNALELGKARKGWFLGYFMDDPNLRTNDLELQCIEMDKGYSKESTKLNPKVKTVTVLVKGKFELRFPEEGKTVVLEKEGDFATYDLRSKHVGTALERTTILCVRWPSIK